MKKQTAVLIGLGVGALALLGVAGYRLFFETRTIAEYHAPPPSKLEELLADDRLEDKDPKFDPLLADRRPEGEWLINQSAAVIRLDIQAAKPDADAELLALRPSYAAAVAAARQKGGREVLPSVNLLDGKAKQFDDGLYAALDQAYYKGLEGRLRSHVDLVRRLQQKVGKDGPAAAFLAAALEPAGVQVEVTDSAAKEAYLREFRADEVQSKPAGFYTWNETLADCFRFLRFLQREFEADQLEVPTALAAALAADRGLAADYGKTIDFYNRLTNPRIALTLSDVAGLGPRDGERFLQLCKEKQVGRAAVAFLPPAASRETVLFERLFPLGLPPDADLMAELVRRIRSGDVSLAPRKDSGWYDYQVYALETLLLPEKGEEKDKLLLTKAYKKRMLEAFQSLLTKRRETHLRDMGWALLKAAAPPRELEAVRPRLRVEPCPSYYLRTARAYAFLFSFLESALGKDTLQALPGLRQGGQRSPDLYAELQSQRDLFYGLYLVSADDIGLKPAFLDGEPVGTEKCYQLAADWLPKAFDDEDLAADTRVCVPIAVDPGRQVTRLWATLGVRLARLDAGYARPPHLKPAKQEGEWKVAEGHQLQSSSYLIPVDEFAEVELPELRSLTREEFREVCDREKTKEAIVAALQKRQPVSGPSASPWLIGGVLGAGVLLLATVYFVGRKAVNRHS